MNEWKNHFHLGTGISTLRLNNFVVMMVVVVWFHMVIQKRKQARQQQQVPATTFSVGTGCRTLSTLSLVFFVVVVGKVAGKKCFWKCWWTHLALWINDNDDENNFVTRRKKIDKKKKQEWNVEWMVVLVLGDLCTRVYTPFCFVLTFFFFFLIQTGQILISSEGK